ncbi:MAG: AGE family epimerase/isomerase [Rhizobium sp.]|nr:AGE family epimerase/isomerase [Rhizobium sp.]
MAAGPKTATARFLAARNPHMHYLEATLGLLGENKLTPKHTHEVGRQDLRTLVITFSCRTEWAASRIFSAPEWELAERYGSDRLEPGHMCEWVWLTSRHDMLAATDHTKICLNLFSTALAMGRMEGSPFIVDAVSASKAISPSRRLWPQVEMLKAFMALHERLGFPGYRIEADDARSAPAGRLRDRCATRLLARLS